MDKMSQLLKLLEKTDYIEINEFRMDFEELELQLMPAMQRVAQQVVTKHAAVQESMKMEAIEFAPPIKDYPGEVAGTTGSWLQKTSISGWSTSTVPL